MLVRPDGAGRRRGVALIGGIGVGVDEHDGERLGALRREGLRLRGDLFDIDRDADRSVRQRALGDFDREIALDDGNEIAAQSPGARSVATAHFEDVAKPWRRDEPDPRALAFQQRVGPDRRAVHDGAELCDAAERLEPGQEPLASSPRCDGVFAVTKRPVSPSNNTRSVNVPPTSTPTIA